MRPRLLLLLLASAIGGSCAYRFSSGGAPLPQGVRTLYAPMSINRTAEPGVEVLFTESFRQQLIHAGTEGGIASDAQVVGEILGLGSAPTVAIPGGRVASYRLFGNAVLRLIKEGQVLSEAHVGGWEDYIPGTDILDSEANRQEALQRLAETLMKDGYERLANGW
jgi:hypothetical protein